MRPPLSLSSFVPSLVRSGRRILLAGGLALLLAPKLQAQQPVELAIERLDAGRLKAFGMALETRGDTVRLVQGPTAIVSRTFASILADSTPTVARWYPVLVRHQLIRLEVVGRAVSVGDRLVMQTDSVPSLPVARADLTLSVEPDGWWRMVGTVTWGKERWAINHRFLEGGAVLLGGTPWVLRIQPLGGRRLRAPGA